MAAGFPTDDPWGDRQQGLPDADFAALLAGGLSFAWSPGTAFEYSNLGYAILGRVVAAAAGRAVPEVVTRRLLEPLGMTSTAFEAADAAPPAPGARLRPAASGTAGSRCRTTRTARSRRWAACSAPCATWPGGSAGYTDAFPPRDDPEERHPLRRSTRREQQQPHRRLPGAQLVLAGVDEPPVLRSAAYGFGLVVEAHPRFGAIVGHSGGYPGFGSHMRWHPDTGLGVVVLGNSTYAPASVLAERLLDALLAARATAPEPVPGAGPGPRPRRPRPTSRSLIAAWDDALAERLFARTSPSTSRSACAAAASSGPGSSSARSLPTRRRRSSGPRRRTAPGGCAARTAGCGSRSG